MISMSRSVLACLNYACERLYSYKIIGMPISDCHVVFHDGKGRSLRLAGSIPCDSLNSYSSILAISAYLTRHLPHVLPPLSPFLNTQITLNQTERFQPIVNVWNNYLLDRVMARSAYRMHDQFYMSVEIPDNSFQAFMESVGVHDGQLTLKEFQNESQRLEHIFSLKVTDPQKIVGIFHTNPLPEELQYSPIINVCANLVGSLFNNQSWTIFDIPRGKVPSVEEIISLDAVLITGSQDTVLNKSKGIQKTIDNLGLALKLAPHLKATGICFGHQLILQYFGAVVVNKQLVGGLQSIQLRGQAIKKYGLSRGLQEVETVLISQCHSDFVENVPQGFELLAQSEFCKVESAISHDGRIFTTQFHWQVLYQSMERYYNQSNNNIRVSLPYALQQSIDRISLNQRDSILFIDFVTDFLN